MELVDCTEDWEFRTLGVFSVNEADKYPTEISFRQIGYAECDRRYSIILFPDEDSWALGDRTVFCLQMKFGLSGTNTSKLDRLVISSRLDVDECLNEAPETDYALVELVSCSGEWQYRVLDLLLVDDLHQYPGEDYFRRRALSDCAQRYTDSLFPTQDSWDLGDRTVICLEEDLGLSASDPEKLDRLVDVSGLSVEACFNEALEAGYALVEVVSCTDKWQYRVLNSFTVNGSDRYPGEDHFRRSAFNECDQRYTTFLFPTEESWSLGDREVTCLQEDYGLSATNLAKLDRLFDLNSLNVEECFNEAPETGYARVELVNCSNGWEFQVVDRFSISLDETYPGEEYMEEIAGQECSVPFDFYYSPTVDTWDLGDRTITCVKSAE